MFSKGIIGVVRKSKIGPGALIYSNSCYASDLNNFNRLVKAMIMAIMMMMNFNYA